MDPLDGEGNDRRLPRRGPDDPDARNLREEAFGPLAQPLLVGGDRLHAEGVEVVGGRRQPHRAGDVRRAGLELGRGIRVGGPLDPHAADHLAAALVRRESLQQVLPAPEDADPGGAVHLVPGHGVEVAAQVRRRDAQVRGRLRPVHHHERAVLPRRRRHLPHRVHRPQRVRDMHQRDDLHAGRQPAPEVVEVEFAGVGDRNRRDPRADRLGDHLPGNDVGVVLHLGDQHLVALAERVAPQAGGREVQPLGGAPDEDDLLRGLRGEEGRHPRPRLLVLPGGPFRQDMDAAVDIRVAGLVHPVHGVEHRPRLLGARRVVQVGDLLPPRLLAQDREVAPDPLQVVRRGRAAHAGVSLHRGRIAASSASARARTGAAPARSMTSPANARMRISRESIAPRPRERR